MPMTPAANPRTAFRRYSGKSELQTASSAVQLAKADAPISVTVLGIVTDVRAGNPEQTALGTLVRPLTKTKVFNAWQLLNGALVSVIFVVFQFTLVKLLLCENAACSTLLTLAGMVTDVRPDW